LTASRAKFNPENQIRGHQTDIAGPVAVHAAASTASTHADLSAVCHVDQLLGEHIAADARPARLQQAGEVFGCLAKSSCRKVREHWTQCVFQYQRVSPRPAGRRKNQLLFANSIFADHNIERITHGAAGEIVPTFVGVDHIHDNKHHTAESSRGQSDHNQYHRVGWSPEHKT
jgi:hypothetical protein